MSSGQEENIEVFFVLKKQNYNDSIQGDFVTFKILLGEVTSWILVPKRWNWISNECSSPKERGARRKRREKHSTSIVSVFSDTERRSRKLLKIGPYIAVRYLISGHVINWHRHISLFEQSINFFCLYRWLLIFLLFWYVFTEVHPCQSVAWCKFNPRMGLLYFSMFCWRRT